MSDRTLESLLARRKPYFPDGSWTSGVAVIVGLAPTRPPCGCAAGMLWISSTRRIDYHGADARVCRRHANRMSSAPRALPSGDILYRRGFDCRFAVALDPDEPVLHAPNTAEAGLDPAIQCVGPSSPAASSTFPLPFCGRFFRPAKYLPEEFRRRTTPSASGAAAKEGDALNSRHRKYYTLRHHLR